MPRLWTIGYERLVADQLVAELGAAGVRRLIDVRFRPQSRRAGLSKTRLAARLAEDGIAYEHRRALGTPPDIRWFYRHGRAEEARRRFIAHLTGEPDPSAALAELAAELRDPDCPPTALLCLEEDPAVCHRSAIAGELRRAVPDLEVIDL